VLAMKPADKQDLPRETACGVNDVRKPAIRMTDEFD